jgi:hypothetical protein
MDAFFIGEGNATPTQREYREQQPSMMSPIKEMQIDDKKRILHPVPFVKYQSNSRSQISFPSIKGTCQDT